MNAPHFLSLFDKQKQRLKVHKKNPWKIFIET